MENSVLGLIILGLLLYFWWLASVESVTVYRFYRPSCGHCRTSQWQWNWFKLKCLIHRVKCVDVNMDAASEEELLLATRFKVKGVPTVIKINPDDSWHVYNGERVADAYLKWANDWFTY